MITSIKDEDNQFRFIINADIGGYVPVNWGLAYLVSEPNTDFEDIKVGDILTNNDDIDFMVLGINRKSKSLFLPQVGWCNILLNFHKKEDRIEKK